MIYYATKIVIVIQGRRLSSIIFEDCMMVMRIHNYRKSFKLVGYLNVRYLLDESHVSRYRRHEPTVLGFWEVLRLLVSLMRMTFL